MRELVLILDPSQKTENERLLKYISSNIQLFVDQRKMYFSKLALKAQRCQCGIKRCAGKKYPHFRSDEIQIVGDYAAIKNYMYGIMTKEKDDDDVEQETDEYLNKEFFSDVTKTKGGFSVKSEMNEKERSDSEFKRKLADEEKRRNQTIIDPLSGRRKKNSEQENDDKKVDSSHQEPTEENQDDNYPKLEYEANINDDDDHYESMQTLHKSVGDSQIGSDLIASLYNSLGGDL